MFLVDYIIIFTIISSVVFGLLRGFYQEVISSFFWFFNFYFFNNYYYFSSFYVDAIPNIFLKNNITLLILVVFFFIIKKMFNFFMKKIIKKVKLSYLNIILGGLFGIFRSMIIIFLVFYFFRYFSKDYYIFYMNHSILISIFLKLTDNFFIDFL